MFRGTNNNRGGGERGGFRGTSSARVKGLFSEGIWHCDCNPRLPAQHFKTNKEGPNHGRWFYKCQKPESVRCRFFLWEDEAKPREEAALLNNSRSEPHAQGKGQRQGPGLGAPGRPVADQSGRTAEHANVHSVTDRQQAPPQTPPPPYTAVPECRSSRSTDASASRKRRLPWQTDTSGDEGDEDVFPWPLTGEEEQELTRTSDWMPPPETPRKALKYGAFDTPGGAHQTGLPTPTSSQGSYPSRIGQRRGSTSAFSPIKQPNFSNPTTPPQADPEVLPSPLTTPATSPSIDISESSPQPTLQSEVATLLFDNLISLPSEVHSTLRSILHKHELRTSGIAKGRDAVRLSIKAKDAKIAELQARIGLLAAERETDRAMISHLRRSKEKFGI